MYKYNPTITDMRQAYEVAYGEQGVYFLIGTMFSNLEESVIEKLYKEALDKVKADMEKAGQI